MIVWEILTERDSVVKESSFDHKKLLRKCETHEYDVVYSWTHYLLLVKEIEKVSNHKFDHKVYASLYDKNIEMDDPIFVTNELDYKQAVETFIITLQKSK